MMYCICRLWFRVILIVCVLFGPKAIIPVQMLGEELPELQMYVMRGMQKSCPPGEIQKFSGVH